MNFIASPWDFPDTFDRIPHLSLRVVVDPTSWEVTDMNARLIFGQEYVDIMIPSSYTLCGISLTDRRCDLRLLREEYIPIPDANSVSSFTNYITETRFDPSRNRRLTAPPFLQLDLESGGSAAGSVKYFLTEMNFRRELVRSFAGHEVVYADIDGGDAWGRRKQVSMVIADHDKPISFGASINAIEALLSKTSS